MTKRKSTLSLVLFCTICIATTAMGCDTYIYKLEGENLYKIEGNTLKKLRVMELVEEDSTIEIGEDTTAYITCADCNVLKLTQAESPFKVNTSEFKKKQGKSKIIYNHFVNALKFMIHPDAKPGERIRFKHRGDGRDSESPCQMSPKVDEEILFLGNAIIFEWEMASETFIFKLWNISGNQLVETSETKNNSYQILLTKLEPDASYEWTISGKDGKQVCQALFSTLSKDESNEIKTNLEALSYLLPPDINEENKLLLQSGYLISEGLYFNADRFFENKGF